MNGKKAKLIRRHVKNYIGKGCTGKEPVQYRAKKHAPKQVFDIMTGKAKVITPVQIFCAEGFRTMVQQTKKHYLSAIRG